MALGRLRARVTPAGACVLTIAALSAQGLNPSPPLETGDGLILGQVVDAATGQGLGGVMVTLAPAGSSPAPIGELLEPRPPGPPPLTQAATARRVLTADDGRFLFRDLPAGRFSITTTSPTHIGGAFGQTRPNGLAQAIEVANGQRRGGIVLRLWPYGSISGTVVDEHGDPAVAVTVRCLRGVISGGQRRWSTTGLGTLLFTDDRGAYRVPNLPPGDYICGTVSNQTTLPMRVVDVYDAAQQSGNPNNSEVYRSLQNSGGAIFGASGMRVGDFVLSSSGLSVTRGLPPPPSADGRLMVYAPVYYPAAGNTRQATSITLAPGEHRGGIDLRLRAVRGVRVSGRVTQPDGPGAYLGITLFPSTGSDLVSDTQAEAGSTVSDSAGAFTFLGIPSGQYVARIKLYPRPAPGAPGGAAAALDLPSRWASIPISVGESDVSDVVIALEPGIRMTGTIVFEGTKPPSAAEAQRLAIRLQSAEGRTSSPIPIDGRVNPDLTFRTTGYAGGQYVVGLLPNSIPSGWSLESAILNGRDISVEPVTLDRGDITGVVITLSDRSTTLTGRVSGDAKSLAGVDVVVWPADSTAWQTIGVVARRFRQERVDEAGRFSATGLPPGAYFVVALPGTFSGDPHDPRTLTILTKTATRISLSRGGTAAADLTLVSR